MCLIVSYSPMGFVVYPVTSDISNRAAATGTQICGSPVGLSALSRTN